MKPSLLAVLGLTLAVFAGPLGCGDSGTGEGGSTGESCSTFHECTNGVCECTTEGKEGVACEEATCADECEVCIEAQ